MSEPQVNLLRPPQIVELENERQAIDGQLNGPWKHLVQDPGSLRRRLGDLNRQLERGRPQPVPDGLERVKLAQREAELREIVTQGMLSKEEMRKNPPGAVD